MDDKMDSKDLLNSVNRSILNLLESNKIGVISMDSFETSMQFGMNVFYQKKDPIPHNAFKLHVVLMIMKEDNMITIQIIQIKGGERTLVDAFQIPEVNIETNIRDKFSIVLTKLGCISFPQLFQIRLIRDQILKYVEPKEFLKLEATCKLMHDICRSYEVDRTFWRFHLKKKYNKDKTNVQETYRSVYRQNKEKNSESQSAGNSLLISSQRPPRYPENFFAPPYPPNPYLPYPDIDPFGRDPSGIGGPFGGRRAPPGLGPELLPSRAPRYQGPRGPPGMGPAGWPQFDRNDII